MEPNQNVQFEENSQANSFTANSGSKVGVTTRFFIKLGLAKDQKGANQVMVVFTILCLILMSYFLITTYDPSLLNFSKPKTNTSNLPPEIQQRLNALRNGTTPPPTTQTTQ